LGSAPKISGSARYVAASAISGYSQAPTFRGSKTLAALHAIPTLQSATISGDIPLLAGAGSQTLYSRADGEILPVDKRTAAASHDIAPDYFKTWGIPILAGRDIDQHDVADHQNVVLISQAGAKKVFGNENPIGKTLLVTSASTPVEIIGVVGDVRSRKVAEPNDMEFYVPGLQENFPYRGGGGAERFKSRCGD